MKREDLVISRTIAWVLAAAALALIYGCEGAGKSGSVTTAALCGDHVAEQRIIYAMGGNRSGAYVAIAASCNDQGRSVRALWAATRAASSANLASTQFLLSFELMKNGCSREARFALEMLEERRRPGAFARGDVAAIDAAFLGGHYVGALRLADSYLFPPVGDALPFNGSAYGDEGIRLFSAATTSARNGDLQSAASQINSMLGVDPNLGEVWWLGGSVAYSAGNVSAARRMWWQSLIRNSPSLPGMTFPAEDLKWSAIALLLRTPAEPERRAACAAALSVRR